MHNNFFFTVFSLMGSNLNAGEASPSRLNYLYETNSLGLGLLVSKPKMVWHVIGQVPVS